MVSPHGMLEPLDLAKKRLKKRVYRWLLEDGVLARAAGLHALSDRELTRFDAFLPRERCRVIPNPVDPGNGTVRGRAPARCGGYCSWGGSTG